MPPVMNALIQEALPTAIAERLTEEQRQAVLEAPRGQRVTTLAAALGQSEGDVIALIAGAAGLGIATDIKPDRASLTLLPGRLVHDYQIVPLAAPGAVEPEGSPPSLPPDSKTVLHLAASWPPNETILDWIRTFTPRPLRWH